MRHKTLENKSASPSSGGSASHSGRKGPKSRVGKAGSTRTSTASTKNRKRKIDDLGEIIVSKRRSARAKAGDDDDVSTSKSKTPKGKKGKKVRKLAVLDDDEVIEYDAFAFLQDFLSLLTDGENEEVAEAFLSHLDYMDVADLVRTGEGLQVMSNAIVDQLAARASAQQ